MLTAVANVSSLRQARWCVVPMPMAEADALPQHCVVDRQWIACKGPKLAEHTQIWHVRIDLAGFAAGPLLRWDPWPAGVPFPAFALSPWVADDLRKAELHATIRFGDPMLHELRLGPVHVELVFDGEAGKVWEITASRDGWHFTVWPTTFSWQDAVPFEWQLVWSDPGKPGQRLENVTVTLTAGEPFVLHFSKRNGFAQLAANAVRVYDRGPIVHGTPLEGIGVMACTRDQPDDRTFDETRLDWLRAAVEGPIVGSARWRDNWLAFGVVPEVVDRPDLAAFTEYRMTPGTIWDERPLALAGETGRTGSQVVFGATKDVMAVQPAPWRVWELLYSAFDPRGIHHRDADGEPVTELTHPQLETWCGVIETQHSQDTLGKARTQPYGWDRLGPRTVTADDQHEGSAIAIATYALTGSMLLRSKLLDTIAVHETRAFPSRGWLDAPRASGRLWQCWAKLACVFDGEVRERLKRLAIRELLQREDDYPTTGEVRPVFTIRDPRVLPDGQTASMPWQDALCALGALEQFFAWQRLGDQVTADRFLAYAVKVGRTVIQYGTVRSAWGTLYPITGLRLNPDGSANDAEYYTYPRVGAGEAPVPGTTMMIGSLGWWSWMVGAIAAVLIGGPDDQVKATARELWDLYSEGGDLNWREWWAIPVPAGTGAGA